MKTYRNILIIFILFTSFLSAQISFESSPEIYNTETVAIVDSTALDAFIKDRMDRYHFPGLTACITKDGEVIWKNNYGYANIAQEKLVTDSTLFSIASVSKTFTGAALMQLLEKDLFELNDNINDYLPFEVKNPSHPNDPITFRMLLSHTSSIRDNWSILLGLYTWDKDSPIELGTFLEHYLTPSGDYYSGSNWYTYTPGSQNNYNNVAIALVGYLVEIISETSLEDYCQDKIFTPLGMTETSWFLRNLNKDKIAIPYSYSGGKYVSSRHIGEPIYPAGQLRTTRDQLARFLMAFWQKGQIDGIRILDNSTVDSMLTVQYQEINTETGLIWFINEYPIPDVGNRIMCLHLGSYKEGVNSLVGYVLETGENVGGIVIANGVNDNGIKDIATGILSYGLITDIEKEIASLTNDYSLTQNYPNPFNPSTTIEFSLPKSENVKLKVYNILGKEVSTIVSNKLNQGNHTYTFDGKNLASGVYYYQLLAGEYREVRKMILIK